eukprot:TRINITY_DN47935_c0_g1_i1.p1 TRINITY_DN47935_c0_g1~~TRINITY_DN47935_c0_g1_i1.p1  ORF type:complete len:550 (-),score=65.49 TRINITY_DN47935_c0_g1_i1:188-1795(-)
MGSQYSLCCSTPVDDAQVWNLRCRKLARPSLEQLVRALKDAGGVRRAPNAINNLDFFAMINTHLPELEIYTRGQVQTSPSVVEAPGSYAEYFRTVGAIIALLAAFADSRGDAFGLEAVSAGKRGPMSVDIVPGKFINMGNKAEAYNSFCAKFTSFLPTEEDWWAMLVLLAVHDVGKCDEFRNHVNCTLPTDLRTDDHDMILAYALKDPLLTAELLPSVHALDQRHKDMLTFGFSTGFQLPQLGQGEMATCSLRGLLGLPRHTIEKGHLALYFYHNIFDVAGASSTKEFIYPLALQPVYVGFTDAMFALLDQLSKLDLSSSLEREAVVASEGFDESSLYFDFLYVNFKAAYSDFEHNCFRSLCDEKSFRHGVGLAMLRILALTRNTYKNPKALLVALQDEKHERLVMELTELNMLQPIMLYYGPDMLRMGLGEGDKLVDDDGSNIGWGLKALDHIYSLVRKELGSTQLSFRASSVFQLNVQPAVSAIKEKGKHWGGGFDLYNLLKGARIESNVFFSEAILRLDQEDPPYYVDDISL